MEELSCDIEYVLQNRDFSVLQKLVSYCCKFRDKVATKIEDVVAYECGWIEKRTQSVHKISELQQEIEALKSEIDTTKLQQKIVDKKIANAIIRQTELQTDVDEEKKKRVNLSLELVDLQQESEKRKEHKLLMWDAIKRACFTYKKYLDFRIQLIDNKEYERIKISFFIHDDNIKDKYYVHLIQSNNQWKVEQIKPILKVEYSNDFKGIVDFSKQSEILDITAFLCKLRHIFVKYYLSIEQ